MNGPYHSHAGSRVSLSVNEESFWPSLTDVMMVVVIIFLMAITAVVLTNWDLTKKIQVSTQLEQEARAQAETLSSYQTQLQQQIASLRNDVSDKDLQLQESSEALTASRQARAHQARVLAERLTETERLQTELLQSEQQQQSQQQELERLIEEQQVREKMLAEVQSDQRQTTEQLATIKEEYGRLDKKYLALARPARSPLGKIVASVRYAKQDGQPDLRIKPPEATRYRPIDVAQMHQLLKSLKDQHGNELFVRIVIPTDSGLTYQEGWQFSLDLLRRYDYYYQKP